MAGARSVLAVLGAAGHVAVFNTFGIWGGASALDVVASEFCSSFGGFNGRHQRRKIKTLRACRFCCFQAANTDSIHPSGERV